MQIDKALLVFGLSLSELNEEMLKKKYRTLSKKYHPDLNNGDDKMFKLLQDAKVVLEERLAHANVKQSETVSFVKPQVYQSRETLRRNANRPFRWQPVGNIFTFKKEFM